MIDCNTRDRRLHIAFRVFLFCVPLGAVGAGQLPAWASPTKLAFFVLLAAWTAWGSLRIRSLAGAVDIWLAVLPGAGLVSLLATTSPPATLTALTRLSALVLLFLFARHLWKTPRARGSLACLALAGTVLSALGIYQTLTSRTFAGLGTYAPYQSLVPVRAANDPSVALVYRAAGTFSHPNELGMFLIGTLTVTLFLMAGARRRAAIAWSCAAALQVIASLYTFSRSCWAGVCICVLLCLVRRSRPRLTLLVVMAALCAGTLLLPPSGRRALRQRGGAREHYDAERLDYFAAAWRMARAHPFTGVGLGAYAERFAAFAAGPVRAGAVQRHDAHNAFLCLAAEAGFPAALAFAAGYIWSLAAGLRRHGLRLAGVPATALAAWVPVLMLNSFLYEEILWLFLAWAQAQRPTPAGTAGQAPPGNRATRALLFVLLALLVGAYVRASGLWSVQRDLSGSVLPISGTPLHDLGASRPRIYLTTARLEQLRRAPHGPHRQALQDWLAAQPPDMPDDQYAHDLRLLARTLPPFALGALLDPTAGHAETARRRLRQIRKHFEPKTQEDIVIAETVFSLSLAYDWLHREWSPAEQTGLLHDIRRGVRELSTRIWKYPPLNNHRVVDAACLGIAGMAVYGDIPEAAQWIQRGWRELRYCARYFDGDGISPEGPGYAAYVLEHLLKFDAAAGPLLDLPSTAPDWIQAAPLAFLHHTVGTGRWSVDALYLSFDDAPSHPWYGPGYLMAGIADLYGCGIAQWIAMECLKHGIDSDSPTAWMYALWHDPGRTARPPLELPPYRHFKNWDIYIARDGWGTNETVLGFTCKPIGGRKLRRGGYAYPGLGHSHPDANSFVLFAHGEHLVAHPGPTHLKRTANHNTLLLDGKGQRGEGATWFRGRPAFYALSSPGIRHTHRTPVYDYVVGDAAAAYPAASRCERQLLWIRPGHLFVLDRVRTRRPAELAWLLHSEGCAEPVDAQTVRIRRGSAELYVRAIDPPGVRLTAGVEDVPRACPRWGIESWQVLRIELPAARDARLLVLLAPVAAGRQPVWPRVSIGEDHTVRAAFPPAAAGLPRRVSWNPSAHRIECGELYP